MAYNERELSVATRGRHEQGEPDKCRRGKRVRTPMSVREFSKRLGIFPIQKNRNAEYRRGKTATNE